MAVAQWLTGKNVAASITPCSLDAYGNIVENGTYSLVGRLDRVSFTMRNTTEEISPMDSQFENYVPIKKSAECEMVEILQGGATGNFLGSAIQIQDFAKVVLTRGHRKHTFVGVCADYSESMERGRCTGTLRMQIVDTGGNNPYYQEV